MPRPTTSMVGRSAEVANLADHLARGTRLVTVLGLGGIGKTRVVLEAVGGLDAYWCDAAAITSAEDLFWSLGVALAIELPGIHLASDPWLVLAAATATLPAHRVVLDALEGLAQTVAIGLETWLARSPTTSLIVTSRRELGTPSEHLLELGPLPSGTIDAPATQLLLARARQARPDWGDGEEALVAVLAARFDGWPLLIELFAAEARVASPRTFLRVMDEREAHAPLSGPTTSTLAAVLERVWVALSPDAARALTRLAALDGTFDLPLAAAVLEVDAAGALVRLAELARHSLVSTQQATDGESVHRILDTVRAFVMSRGEGSELAASQRLAAQAIIRRYGAVIELTPSDPPPIPPRDLERLFALIERGMNRDDPEAVATAFLASRILLRSYHLERTSMAPLLRGTRLIIASAGTQAVPLHARLAVVRQLCRWEIPQALWDDFIAVVERWLSEASEPSEELVTSRLELTLHVGLRHFAEWKYRRLLTLLEAIPRGAVVPGSFVEERYEVFMALARRGLGKTDLGDGRVGRDELRLGELRRGVAAKNLRDRELNFRVNEVFLAGQLGREHALTLAREVVKECESSSALAARTYALRELARIEVERGRFVSAFTHFETACGSDVLLPRDLAESWLERVATLLESARIEDAWAALQTRPRAEESCFAKAYALSLSWVIGSMLGRAIPTELESTSVQPTDTIEDDALAVFWAICRPEREHALAHALAQANASAPYSTRVRQAIRIGQAVLGVTRGTALGVALDGSCLRVGERWQPIAAKPLLAALLRALVAARLEDPERTLTKDALGALLWPGDKSAAEHRDNRLHVAVATLRRLGLETMLVHDGRGFRLDPARPLVRLVPSALP